MKKKLIIISLIIILVISLIFTWIMFTPRYATADDLELTISIEKETVNKTQEPSNKIYISLTNVGDENVRVNKHFSLGGLVYYDIITPSNVTIFPYLIDYTVEEINTILSPNEKLNTIVDIFDYEYGFYTTDNTYDVRDYIWNETGLFKIQFLYVIDHNLETIESNVIEFWYEE